MKAEVLVLTALLSAAPIVSANDIIAGYRAETGAVFDAANGGDLWRRSGKKGRVCADCHGRNLTQPGKHMRTGKKIEPMASSANPKRFTDPKKVEKWFKRNCKWTWGRECTAREKGHLLTWLTTQ